LVAEGGGRAEVERDLTGDTSSGGRIEVEEEEEFDRGRVEVDPGKRFGG
jgi:hypothetical protein